jgi:hypothetical protein
VFIFNFLWLFVFISFYILVKSFYSELLNNISLSSVFMHTVVNNRLTENSKA